MTAAFNSPRILIVGQNGQLARELQRSFAGLGEVLAAGHQVLDLADRDSIAKVCGEFHPDVVLNAAAYTAVDRAESEPQLAHSINATGAGLLAAEAKKHDAIFVHYSTDYVFDGSKSEEWTEEDLPNPLNEYGKSKLAGEQAVTAAGAKSLIFRTSWVYGPHGSNFLFTMLRLGRERDRLSIVDDQVGSPTSSIELADATRNIVGGILGGRFGAAEDWSGIYHMTCAGSVSWFGFAQAIFSRAAERMELKTPLLNAIPTASYPTPARRPRNSVLSNARLANKFGVHLAPWNSALDHVFDQLVATTSSRG